MLKQTDRKTANNEHKTIGLTKLVVHLLGVGGAVNTVAVLGPFSLRKEKRLNNKQLNYLRLLHRYSTTRYNQLVPTY